MWGTNAVNGVISIFTRSSKEAEGGMVTAGGGSQVRGMGVARYGAPAGRNAAFRAWGKSVDPGDSAAMDGSLATDRWLRMHGGFRADWDSAPRDSLMVQGELFASQANETRRSGFIPTLFDEFYRQELDAAGGNLLARWTHTLAGGSQTTFQAYYDHYRRTEMGVPEVLTSFDLDFQHHFAAGDRQDIVWGFGYRAGRSGVSPGYAVAFKPPFETAHCTADSFRMKSVQPTLWFLQTGRFNLP